MKTLLNSLKERFINILHGFGLAWWVEIGTQNPRCTYYFGPFLSSKEAEAAKTGYVEDLTQEGAIGIVVKIKRCKPANLTISDDLGDKIENQVKPIFSGQM